MTPMTSSSDKDAPTIPAIKVTGLTNTELAYQDTEVDIEVEPVSQELSEQNVTIKEQQVQLSDFIGEHGAYQLALTILLFIRYVLLGLMANSGPLMTPDVTFYCRLPMDEILSIMPNISLLGPHEQELEIREEFKQVCQIDLHLYNSRLQALNESKSFKTAPLGKIGSLNLNFSGISTSQSIRIRECAEFNYDLARDQGTTMTSEFDLVCDRDWLRSLFQSLLSASIVVAHVFWGTFSDKYGRFQAQRLCMLVSLIAGLMSIFAFDFWSFTAARALCSFGDLGLVVSQTTTLVELVGQRYRGSSVAIVNFGFALGVSLLPYIVAYFEDFRLVTGFTVLCHMVTMPFMLATNESPRWLLTNMKFKAARKELKRIARWNRSCSLAWQSTKFLSLLKKYNQEQESRRVIQYHRETKQRFEVMFNQFIKQIESQNLYDPVADAEVRLKNRVTTLKDGPQTTIVHQPQMIHITPPLGSTRLSSTVVNPSIDISKHDNLSVPSSRSVLTPDVSASKSVCTVDIEQNNPDDLCNSNKPIRRAYSCNLLQSETPSLEQGDSVRSQAQEQAETLRDRTLTLPIANPDSSIHHEEGDDDSFFEPLRRRRLELGTQQHDCITSCNIVAQQLSFVGRVSRLFKDKKLMVAVFAIVWTTFNSELLYTSFIIINLEVGEDVYLNYILGGCMEALAAVSASLLLSYSPRKRSLIAFWLLISMSCFGLSLAHIDSTWAVWMLSLAKFSQSTLSSIAAVAAYESFPTFLRQSGSGLVFTLGMMGSVFAPLIFAEFDDQAGMDRVLMTFSCSSLTAATLIHLFLTETRGCELK